MDTVHTELRGNRLLALLDDAALRAIAPLLQPVALALREDLYQEQAPMRHAWFPTDGVLSMLGSAAAETDVEVATIGSEGMLGAGLLLGAELSFGRAFVQVEGTGWRMEAADLRSTVVAQPPFGRVLHRYANALLVQIAQGAACNRAHAVEQRCARWLLQTHDRVRGDEFELTQEFLAQMLGERLATVNQVAASLQKRGLIQYTRGRIQVTDREGLEAAACRCYGFVRTEYGRMLSPPA
ncbi:Crp/Fnr family transcriptional regulator [Ramlibacter monticola]|uniref:Crp/Fnr family transcriptional regulator n=1 Tax=Ramlibacter monticola TaxID=1926872 RepID=A0A937CU12_9BURK|nr:Crp/Fnr family transcriptional regulator [Ramlibacter monticola]MBL0392881.1 Crp/Fnr family transcriptional regulator [Ramlibacter monticola]